MNLVKLPIWPWKTWYVRGRVPPTITSTPWMPLVTRPTNSPTAVPRSMLYHAALAKSKLIRWDGMG